MHFHAWSEHKVSEQRFASELHIVFMKEGNHSEDNFCVMGILIDIKNENETFKYERDIINIFKPSTPSVSNKNFYKIM